MLGLGGEPWSTYPDSRLFTTPDRAAAMLCLVTIAALVLGRVGNCHSFDSVTLYCKAWLRLLLEKGEQEGQVREKGTLFVQCCWVLDHSTVSRNHTGLSPSQVQETRWEYLRTEGFPLPQALYMVLSQPVPYWALSQGHLGCHSPSPQIPTTLTYWSAFAPHREAASPGLKLSHSQSALNQALSRRWHGVPQRRNSSCSQGCLQGRNLNKTGKVCILAP